MTHNISSLYTLKHLIVQDCPKTLKENGQKSTKILFSDRWWTTTSSESLSLSRMDMCSLSWSGRQSPVFIPITLICGIWGCSRTFYLHPSFPPFVSARRQAAPTSRTHWGSIYINLRIDSPQRVCHRLMSWSHHSNLSRLSGNLQIDLWTRFGTPSDGWQIPSRISQGICRSYVISQGIMFDSFWVKAWMIHYESLWLIPWLVLTSYDSFRELIIDWYFVYIKQWVYSCKAPELLTLLIHCISLIWLSAQSLLVTLDTIFAPVHLWKAS